jgi:K+-sensing histidine kinase KdpD
MKLRRLQASWGLIVTALLGSTVLTLVIFVCVQLHTRLAIVALLCLLTIVVISLQGRFLVALICSVLAVLGLDYFFMQPIFSLVVTRPEDIAALSTFSTIALIVSALGSKMRKSYFQLARESNERIRAEEAWRETQAQLAHVTRVATLGELAGSIAHEVNHAFYTTKPQGLGMGLSISRSIIEAHGGWLCAKANEPKGALFQFMLPIAND